MPILQQSKMSKKQQKRLPFTTLKVKQYTLPVKKEESLQNDLIPKICDVKTRNISEYQNVQEEGL